VLGQTSGAARKFELTDVVDVSGAVASEKTVGRPRVFCALLADVFDNRVPPEWRRDLFALIRECKRLDWLMLTKRPQNITKMLPPDWG
jgi:protein gp37